MEVVGMAMTFARATNFRRAVRNSDPSRSAPLNIAGSHCLVNLLFVSPRGRRREE
jgi:hypothetical protein